VRPAAAACAGAEARGRSPRPQCTARPTEPLVPTAASISAWARSGDAGPAVVLQRQRRRQPAAGGGRPRGAAGAAGAHLSGLAWKGGILAISSSSSCSRVLKAEGRERVEVHRTGSCRGGGGGGGAGLGAGAAAAAGLGSCCCQGRRGDRMRSLA
jgi:hypothetical protein